jgi:phosphohistidine swiveling domain-containing protein
MDRLADSVTTAFLGDAASRDATRVGAKAATLSRLADRFRVPAGFCLDASVFDRLGAALAGDRTALAALRALVAEGHAALSARTGRADPAVAVRSSAIGEDGAETSFAGQHETVLDVRGVDAITDAVLRCWRSASSERAVAYRKEHGVSERPRVGVLVQELVAANAAAIAFSADPVTGDRGTIVIDATSGLGEAIASGSVTPDTYAVRKSDIAIVKRTLAGERPALADDQVREVARLALALEAESGVPVDVECAFADGSLYLLQSRPITTLRESFPVRWVDPADAELTWQQEDAHMAEARPPLSSDYSLHGPQVGLNKRSESLDGPTRVRYQVFNCYMYFAQREVVPSDRVAETGRRALGIARRQARELRHTWDAEYLPSVHAHYEAIDALEPARLDRAAAVAAWDDLWQRVNAIWITHMKVTGPAYSVLDELGEVYAALTGRAASEAQALVQGRADTLQAMERGIHDIVAAIRARSAVAAAIERGEGRSLDAIAPVSGGDAVVAAIQAFLAEYGDAGQLALDLRTPSWSDDPGLLIADIARRMRGTHEDPELRRARLLGASAEIEDRVRAQLRDRPEDLAGFDEVVATARAAGPLTEEHNFWIDRKVGAYVRRAVLRFGARLVANGTIATADDIFYLWVAETRDALRDPRDLRALVVERRRELRSAERLRAPKTIGKAPPATAGPPLSAANLQFKMTQTRTDILTGVPASAGVGRGPVRLVRDPSRFDRFERGDVLVCTSSNVSWIPLFTIAAAVIADVGGVLSHAAVVAREFGVPAVVGTGSALDLLVEGELVEVDGSAGTVRRVTKT